MKQLLFYIQKTIQLPYGVQNTTFIPAEKDVRPEIIDVNLFNK